MTSSIFFPDNEFCNLVPTRDRITLWVGFEKKRIVIGFLVHRKVNQKITFFFGSGSGASN